MFVVVQEVKVKKSDKGGYPKELKSEWLPIVLNGEDIGHYYHYYGYERFERPVKKAYRISFYDLATDSFSIYDWCDSKIALAADGLSVGVDVIYELVERKLEPLIDKIQKEFHETEEFKTHEKHDKITTIYAAKKAEFNQKYGLKQPIFQGERLISIGKTKSFRGYCRSARQSLWKLQ